MKYPLDLITFQKHPTVHSFTCASSLVNSLTTTHSDLIYFLPCTPYPSQREVVLDSPLILRQNHQRAKQDQQLWKDKLKFQGKELPLQYPMVDDVAADNLCFKSISELTGDPPCL